SLLCAFAPSAEFLIVVRALQGAAAALLVPSSLAIIISTFHGQAQAKAIGTWTAWTGTAMIVGPLLGGLLVDTLSWRLVFGINVLPIAITLWLLMKMDKDPERLTRPRVDAVGAFLGAIGLGGPVFALIEQARFGWDSPVVWVPLVVGVIAFGLFIWWESRTRDPMMPLSLFRSRNFSAGNIATVFIYGALGFGFFVIAIYLQQVAGWPATLAGLATLPPTLVMLLLSSRIGSLAGKYGPRLFMTIGPIVAGIAFLLMRTVTDDVNYWLQLFPGLVLFGIGLSITVAPLTSAILGAIDPSQAGIGSAVNNAVARVAGLVAVACAGLILGNVLDLAGFHRAMIATALMLIVGGVVSFAGIRNPVLVEATAQP
ncbi:MAG: MFS transporter, partial [Microterricola sp.]